jgi:hypothetical protein
MANGKFTGLQYRPLQGDIATDMLNQEDQDSRLRDEMRLIADRKARAQAEKDKKAQEALNRAKGIKLFDTGSDSLNGTLAETVILAQQEYPKIFEVLDHPDKYSLAEQTQAKLKLDYLNEGGLVNELKLMTSSVMGEYSEYQKGVAEGALYQDPDYESRFENGYKGVTLSLDENLRPVALFKQTSEDADGDGILDVETMDSLNDVHARPQFQKKFDYDNLVTQHVSKLESAVNANVNGFKTTTTTGVEVDLLDKSVKRVLYDEYGNPTDVMKSFLREKGFDPNKPNKADMDKVEADYKNDIYIRTKRGKQEDLDAGAIVSNKRENRLANEEKATLGEAVTPSKNTWGEEFGNIDTNKVNSVNLRGKATIPALRIGDDTYLSNANVENITRNKNKEMVLDVEYQESKTETMTNDQFEKALDQAVQDNDFEKLAALKVASDVQGGGKRVTYPSKNRRKVVVIPEEDEADVAGQLRMNIDEVDSKIYKEPNGNETPQQRIERLRKSKGLK